MTKSTMFAAVARGDTARRTLSAQAQLFLEGFEAEIARIQDMWAKIIPPAVYPERPRRTASR